MEGARKGERHKNFEAREGDGGKSAGSFRVQEELKKTFGPGSALLGERFLSMKELTPYKGQRGWSSRKRNAERKDQAKGKVTSPSIFEKGTTILRFEKRGRKAGKLPCHRQIITERLENPRPGRH